VVILLSNNSSADEVILGKPALGPGKLIAPKLNTQLKDKLGKLVIARKPGNAQEDVVDFGPGMIEGMKKNKFLTDEDLKIVQQSYEKNGDALSTCYDEARNGKPYISVTEESGNPIEKCIKKIAPELLIVMERMHKNIAEISRNKK
jgi:hypothetical protein